MQYFSVDWFSNNIPTWQKILKRFVGQKCNALEVGSYEGRSASWLLDNILTHPGSRMVCIDNFSYKDKATRKDVFRTFASNMSKYGQKCKLLKGNSRDMLKTKAIVQNLFDIIYIDADHHSKHVLEDAILAYASLKPGGIMIFDDNTDNKEHDNRCPKPAIQAFVNAYASEVKVLHAKWQVVIMKRLTPLKHSPCYSEFFKEEST